MHAKIFSFQIISTKDLVINDYFYLFFTHLLYPDKLTYVTPTNNNNKVIGQKRRREESALIEREEEKTHTHTYRIGTKRHDYLIIIILSTYSFRAYEFIQILLDLFDLFDRKYLISMNNI